MEARPIEPRAGEAAVLVGTTKGAYLMCGGPGGWRAGGPWFAGRSVESVMIDQRAGGLRLFAGTVNSHWGPAVFRSDDAGATWEEAEGGGARFPADTDAALAKVWQLQAGPDDEPEVVYAGVEPAALFRSDDGGRKFELVRGLWDHPHRPQWQPGGGGLCLHTIIRDPGDDQRMWVAISTGGVYRTEDGGETWKARNQGIRAPFLPDPSPEFGQCVHKVVQSPSRPDTLFLQHHWGVYRSDDAGDSWRSVGEALPSDFGFPIVAHPHEPETIFVLPLESDMVRIVPDARLRVHRSRDGGGTWEALGDGLPDGDAWTSVLRDAMCADDGDPPGIYVGTRSGGLYASADAGDHWETIAPMLPPVLCVKAARLRT